MKKSPVPPSLPHRPPVSSVLWQSLTEVSQKVLSHPPQGGGPT